MGPLLSMVWLPQQLGTRHSPIEAAASPELVMLGDSSQVGGAKLASGNLRYGGVAPCMIDRVWARLAGARRIAGNGRVDSSARHHARRSGYGPAADPVKGRRCVPNGGKDLDSASGSY